MAALLCALLWRRLGPVLCALLVLSLARQPGCLASRHVAQGHPRAEVGAKSRKAATRVPLYAFGDSQLDVGNNNYLNTDIKANFPPYGINYIPSSGRNCDGKLVVDYIAGFMGIPSPPPYLKVQRQKLKAPLGINFASAGAGILNSTDAKRAIPLFQQLDYFLKLVSSGAISKGMLSQAVFIVNIGANDLQAMPTDYLSIPGYLGSMGAAYIQFFSALYRAGATKFIRLSVAPLGCTPYVRALAKTNPPDSCVSLVNNLAYAFNVAMDAALGAAGAVGSLTGYAKIVSYDQHSAALDLIQNYKARGFTSPNACCGAPSPLNGLVQCGRSHKVGNRMVKATVCKRPGRYLFWDYYHPTQRVNQIGAKLLWHGSKYTTPAGGAKTLFQK